DVCRGSLPYSLGGRTEGSIVLHTPLHPPDLGNQVVELLLVMNEIDLIGVDDEKGSLGVVEEEVVVRLGYLRDVGLGDLGLVVALAALDALDQPRGVGLQEDDEIG